jgi:hypothetical protein
VTAHAVVNVWGAARIVPREACRYGWAAKNGVTHGKSKQQGRKFALLPRQRSSMFAIP